VIDFNCNRIAALLNGAGFNLEELRGSGIIYHRQILPYWMMPVRLASNIICLAVKNA